ncbi:MAG TPA: SUMF1/EgtB/PvdO family nonheme iron enzyme [Polyangiaceae bacterium]|jgi:formylglycine-generating enzyme required for sulfatase activity|nr:SUMF1/EgtB/PvdO family nonheme iron enzyme [Polyangiaceae bacterium]
MDRAAALSLMLTCAACTNELDPLGEAILIVDTDLPVPELAAELRLDLYSPDGTAWYHSRDIALPDPRDWPASFSLYDPDPESMREALVRVRIHPLGRVRDYHGERFAPVPIGLAPGDVPPEPMAEGEAPRLFVDGVDATPRTEPQPLLTIDRLFLLRLEPGKTGSVQLTLRGACAGTMADVAGRATCIDTRAVLVPVEELPLNDELEPEVSSVQGSFAPPSDCSAAPRPASPALFDEEVCVQGGAFVFGNSDVFGFSFVDPNGDRQSADGVPERVAVVPPFRMDRYEVTVGRWRQALAEGFVSPDLTPTVNDGPLLVDESNGDPGVCTWSSTDQGREHYPVNCVSWVAARAFCARLGGDLPTEAQWEYAAQVAGRETKTRYPWGTTEPTCDHVIFARLAQGTFADGNMQCAQLGTGPQPVNAAEHDGGDVTPGTRIVQLGGGMTEMMRDDAHPLTAACWLAAPLESPTCVDPTRPYMSLRGGAWHLSSVFVHPGLRASRRRDIPPELGGGPLTMAFVGFRCARAGAD